MSSIVDLRICGVANDAHHGQGTFGPVASAFNLCALVEKWRTSIPPGGTEEHGNDIKDPKW